MALYKRYPRLCTVWCCVEIALYAGQLFGWSSLLFVLKQEGFYENQCYLDYSEAQGTNDYAKYTIKPEVSPKYPGGRTQTLNGTTLFLYPSATGSSRPTSQSNIETIYKAKTLPKNSTKPTNQINYRVINVNNTVNGAKGGSDLENDIRAKSDRIVIGNNMAAEHAQIEHEGVVKENHPGDVQVHGGCTLQDSKLNLWFSVAICFSYVMCAFLGPIMSRIGMRFFRLFFM